MTATLVACTQSPQPPQADLPEVVSPVNDKALEPDEGWSAILGATSAPAGWRVAPCENPALLCMGYVTTDGETLYIFTTGVMDGEAAGFFTSEADLETFEPHLDQIIQKLAL